MKQVVYRSSMVLIMLCALIGTGIATTGEDNGTEQDFQVTSQEMVFPGELETLANSTLLEESDLLSSQIEYINGTGNLTKKIEVNNTAGERATGHLMIVGTNETSWMYEIRSGNATDKTFVWSQISVQQAQKVFFESNANNTAGQVAYAGIGLAKGGWDDAGPYSGTVMLFAAVDLEQSASRIETNGEEGSIIHLTQAYRETGDQSSELNISRMKQVSPDADWNLSLPELKPPSDVMFYDQYAGSYLNLRHGKVFESQYYSVSGPNSAKADSIQNIGKAKEVVTNTIGEEWPEGHLRSKGSGSYEQFDGTEITTLMHRGKVVFKKGDSAALGESYATGNRLRFLALSSGDQEANPLTAAYTQGMAESGTVPSTRSGQIPIPASYDGGVLVQNIGGSCKDTEKYTINGAYVKRKSDGGIYIDDADIPQTGVQAHISAGKQGSPPGSSRLQGQAILTVSGTAADPTTLEGRWIASSPASLPVSRSIQAIMPGYTASTSSTTVSGVKYISESGYYRSGMVDVS